MTHLPLVDKDDVVTDDGKHKSAHLELLLLQHAPLAIVDLNERRCG